jgi:hypothetical protein
MYLKEKRKEIVLGALEARKIEWLDYQINLENYELALSLAVDEDLQQFRDQLGELIRTTRIEQKKSKILLDVLTKQAEALE